jgi:lipopolysaccharide export system protein LptA
MKPAPLIALSAMALIAAGAAGAVQAQQAGKAGAGGLFRLGQGPMGLSADHTSYTPQTCTSTWIGKVEATQDQTRMRADQLVTYSHHEGASKDCVGQFDRIEATGNVFYVTPDIKARGDKAIYLVSNDTVTITGRVVVTSDQGVSETNKLVLNVVTNEATMGDTTPGQRVKAVVYPKDNPKKAPDAPKKAPAAK